MRAHAAAVEEQRRREQEEERRQRGPPPASRMALKNIPEVKIAALDLAEETNRSCSVCLEDHELGETVVKLPCAHIFHRECVWEWLELHCTCPVCRFELETEDAGYERERRLRMRGRRPRYRRQELEGLSIPQVRNLARGQNVNIAGCLEKADIVRCLLDSGTIEVVESEIPSYDAEELSNMGLRQLRSLMLQAGIGTEGCLEKADLLDRIVSSRLVTVTHGEAVPPPAPPAPPSFANRGGSGGGSAARQAPERGATAGAGAAAAAPARGPGGVGERRWAEPNSNSFSRAGIRPWWWRAGRRGGGGGGSAERAATQAGAGAGATGPPPPPSPQPGAAAAAAGAGAAAARPLESMSVKELREITSRLGVSTAGCLEKRDMVERIRSCGRYREAAGVGRP
ncbi:unnamed protein product [Ectocarpus sp. CCAP 1310/34]|nr:unnamed protein product [Ectocarpus sp. CCAP 1310/34]